MSYGYCHKHPLEYQQVAPIRIIGAGYQLDGEFCGACYAALINTHCTRLTGKGMQLDPEPDKAQDAAQTE